MPGVGDLAAKAMKSIVMMRVTVCETPHDPALIDASWAALCTHTKQQDTEVLVLPEFSFLMPLWVDKEFDPDTWQTELIAAQRWLGRMPELQCEYVIGAFPVTEDRTRFNLGFLWSASGGYASLRRKCFLPNQPGGWEARWFARGDPDFPAFQAGEMSFGLNICTELWALETYGKYAAMGIHAIVSPRATATATIDKWLSTGKVAAVRAGAYSLSSNRVHADGSCGGVGWIIDPDGLVLATTSASEPFVTRELSLELCASAKSTYPRYAFEEP